MLPTYRTVIQGVTTLKIGAPISVQVELTEACQYRCIFCYNAWRELLKRRKVKALTREQTMLIVHKLIELEIFDLVYSGDEPTLCPHLVEAVELATRHGIEVSLISNAANLTPELLRQLDQAGMTSLQVSMHHFDAATMDRLTDHTGSFRKTLTGVQNTVRILGPERISVNMVVMKPTVADVYRMGMFLHQHGVFHFSVGLVSYCGMAARNDLLVDATDVVTVYDQLERLAAETGMEVAFTGGMPHCVVPEREGSPVVMANVCDAALYQLVIGPDGAIRPCVESPVVAGNALTDDIRTVWQTSPELISIRRFEDVPESCWPCLKVSQCHGGCRASAFKHTGDVRGLDPLMIGGKQ